MINKDEREDRYEESEEGEYHFSDDEVNYEVESEASHVEKETKPNFLDRLKTMSRSRRMLLSILVFLALVFIVYRMVAPTAVTQSTEITPATIPVTQVPPTTQVTPPAQIAISTVPEMAQRAPAQPMTATAPASSVQATTPAPSVPQTLPQPGTQVVPSAQPTVVVPSVQPVAPVAQAPTQAELPSQPTVTTTTQSTTPTQISTSTTVVTTPLPTAAPVTEQPTVPATAPQELPSPGTTLQTSSDKALERLEEDYSQKFDAYAAQNKELQNQMQALTTRVASMETQMNQLIRAITRQADETRVDAAPPPVQAAPQRIPYTVQAIIPGRAWLRSDNGETITVAEGDTIKNLGRVTKIDPYDGIVEINTGSKVLTLTYGNGG